MDDLRYIVSALAAGGSDIIYALWVYSHSSGDRPGDPRASSDPGPASGVSDFRWADGTVRRPCRPAQQRAGYGPAGFATLLFVLLHPPGGDLLGALAIPPAPLRGFAFHDGSLALDGGATGRPYGRL